MSDFDSLDPVPRLTQVGRALTYATSLDETLQLTVECAADLLGTRPILLMLKNPEGELQLRASFGFEQGSEPLLHTIMDELLIERLRSIFGDEAAERFIGVPLVVAGEVIGLLVATRLQSMEHARAEWLLSVLADQASIALERARQVEARADLLSKLQVAEAVADARDHALRVLSHDLRTPLSTIISYTELLDAGMLGPIAERQHLALERMRESGQHLIGLLQNVLEMSRLTAGAVTLAPRSFDVVSAIHEAFDVAVTPRSVQHDFKVETSGTVTVYADPVAVRQVLIHLIDNVLKYTPAGTRVRLSCETVSEAGQSWGLVRFTDNGPGIRPDRLERIFEPFERAVDGTGPSQSGSGLGLAIARALIQQMGGKIEVSSTVGSGTTFLIRLPVAAG